MTAENGGLMKASGEFEVNLKPLRFYVQGSDGIDLGRMSINKTFKGDLVATSKGEMLSTMTMVKGSAGYVAMELVSGTLGGKIGNFVLQHFGIMNHGEQRLILEVVPDSGTRKLQGLSGKMSIDVVDGKHFYEFEYDL